MLYEEAVTKKVVAAQSKNEKLGEIMKKANDIKAEKEKSQLDKFNENEDKVRRKLVILQHVS